MRTKACRKKLMADLKLATKNCIKSVEKTHATEKGKKKLLASVIVVSKKTIVKLRKKFKSYLKQTSQS